ncbi:hypothetical protein [Puniceibacterium confluentis]|nr:hypothetical protein [Puniceibacterium confluentis]
MICRIAVALGKYPHQVMTEIPIAEVEILDAYLELLDDEARNA